MVEWLETIAIDEKVTVRKVGMSLSGLDLHMIVIGQKGRKRDEKRDEKRGEKRDDKEEGKSFALPRS